MNPLALLAGLALCLSLGAEEQVFELEDGRQIHGVAAGGEDGDLLIAVQAAGVSAQVRIAKSAVKASRPASASDVDLAAGQPEEKAGETKSATAAVDLEIRPRSASVEADFARLRRLLRQAEAELAGSPGPVTPELPNPLPQGLDPTYHLLYEPLTWGVPPENYQGLVYREGVLPRAWGHGPRGWLGRPGAGLFWWRPLFPLIPRPVL